MPSTTMNRDIRLGGSTVASMKFPEIAKQALIAPIKGEGLEDGTVTPFVLVTFETHGEPSAALLPADKALQFAHRLQEVAARALAGDF